MRTKWLFLMLSFIMTLMFGGVAYAEVAAFSEDFENRPLSGTSAVIDLNGPASPGPGTWDVVRTGGPTCGNYARYITLTAPHADPWNTSKNINVADCDMEIYAKFDPAVLDPSQASIFVSWEMYLNGGSYDAQMGLGNSTAHSLVDSPFMLEFGTDPVNGGIAALYLVTDRTTTPTTKQMLTSVFSAATRITVFVQVFPLSKSYNVYIAKTDGTTTTPAAAFENQTFLTTAPNYDSFVFKIKSASYDQYLIDNIKVAPVVAWELSSAATSVASGDYIFSIKPSQWNNRLGYALFDENGTALNMTTNGDVSHPNGEWSFSFTPFTTPRKVFVKSLFPVGGSTVIDVSNLIPLDRDGDGVPDRDDNCVDNFNSDQSDVDSDGTGDVCDLCPSYWSNAKVPCPGGTGSFDPPAHTGTAVITGTTAQACVQWKTVPGGQSSVFLPDCYNVHFELVDTTGAPLLDTNGDPVEPECLLPPPYNVADAVTVTPNDTYCITCDLSLRFPQLLSLPTTTNFMLNSANYSSYITDPWLLPSGACASSLAGIPATGTCKNTWIGQIALVKSNVTPTITWGNPADITAGTPLSGIQLNATAVAVSGTFVYQPDLGTVLTPGTHSLKAIFTPADLNAYAIATKSVTIQVAASKTTPNITWNTPAPIIFGKALTGLQLNATASVPGTFVYTPAIGTILGVGTQTLSAVFTPTDTTSYNSATKSVQMSVYYRFVGFQSPYYPPTVNDDHCGKSDHDHNVFSKSYKVGSTVPLKWQYANASGTIQNSASSNVQIQITRYADDDNAVVTILDLGTAGGSGYQYDSKTKTWKYNWKTTDLAPGRYKVYVLNLTTGQTDGPFPIKLKKK